MVHFSASHLSPCQRIKDSVSFSLESSHLTPGAAECHHFLQLTYKDLEELLSFYVDHCRKVIASSEVPPHGRRPKEGLS